MAGMLSNFIAGAATAGAEAFGRQALEDMRRESEMLKEARLAELKAVTAEQQRQSAATRVKGYFAPVETTVPGAATPFDDEGNSTDVNSYKSSRDPTTREAQTAAMRAGDLPAAGMMESILHKDEQLENMRERERVRLLLGDKSLEGKKYAADARSDAMIDVAKINTESREGIAGMKYFNPDGTPKEQGSLTKEKLRFIQHDIDANNTKIRDTQKLLDDLDGANMAGLRGDVKTKRRNDLLSRMSALNTVNAALRENYTDRVDAGTTPKTGGMSGIGQTPPNLYDTKKVRPPLSSFMGGGG